MAIWRSLWRRPPHGVKSAATDKRFTPLVIPPVPLTRGRYAPLLCTSSSSTSGHGRRSISGNCSHAILKTMEDVKLPDNFPVGLKILVVDDDYTSLSLAKKMLLHCQYDVTTCSEATEALFLLREKGGFDLIMADIHMPDMDGFRLLELVGLDMDLPVIMMSADSRFNSVLKGLRRGACGFLCKPLRMEELQTIWQFVIKKKCQNNRGLEHSGSMDDSDGNRQVTDDTENALILNGVTNVSRRSQEKKRDDKEDGGEPDNADPPSKKPRVAWSFELHQQFVNAINQIGIDRAVPKRILDLMNVPGLTRAKVASHLQKFRLQLKKLSGIAKQNAELGNFLLWASLNADLAQLGKLDNRTLSILKKITPEALVALQEMSAINQPVQQQGSAQEINSLTSGQGIAFEKLLLKCKGVSSHFPVLPSNNLGVVGPADASTLGRLCAQNKDNPVTMLQHQQPNAVLSESGGPINMQPSCSVSPPQSSNCVQVHEDIVLLNENSMVVPLQSPATLQAGGVVTPVNPNSPVGASLLCTSSLTGNYPAMINHSSMLGPSRSMTRALVGNNPGQSSTGIPSKQWTHFHASSSSVSSQSSTAVQAENNLATANCNFVLSKDSLIMDYGQLSCQLNNVPVRMAQILVGSFKNPMAKGYSIPGSISSSLPFPFQSDSSNRQNPHGGIDDPDGSHCLVPDSCNARATSTLLGTMPDQGQGRSLGFVDKITCSPSWFLGDGNESPSDYLIHSEICTDPDEHVQDHHHSGCDKMA